LFKGTAEPAAKVKGVVVKLRSFQVFLFVCLSILLGSYAALAQQVQPLEPEWLQRMYSEGWQKVQEGVLQRNQGQGQIETFNYGAEGLQWVLEDYQRRLADLEQRYSESPTEALATAIEALNRRIASVSDELTAAPSAETISGEGQGPCPVSAYALSASAGPQRSPRGVTATASASYNASECGSLPGEAFVQVTADATEGGYRDLKLPENRKTTNVDGYNGFTASLTASASGSTACRSEALAQVIIYDPNYFVYSVEPAASNYTCPADIATTITGPALVGTDFYTSSCTNVVWSANPTGGTPGYTYQWYVDSVAAGTGSTLTKPYCSVNKVVGIRLVVTDQNQWSTEANFSTEIRHTPPVAVSINGLDRVDLTSATPCMDVTWSASATGGHPGYTYTWYTGTGTTAEGTGSTFVKRYCNSSQVVTARVVTRDSDGHTTEATKQTNIVYTSPLTASVSGPALVVTDYYTSTCADVTWTASVSGGAPGYTYKWYLGTNTTVQGTGTTFTKNYCTTNGTVTAKVVVTDNQGSTANTTFSTTFEYRPAITPTITASMVTSSSCTNVTWTANATGGNHTGFTYSWYIGTGTTVQSSTSTFTKSYCTGQTVTVKVIAKASDGHTSEATKTTTIPPPVPPLATTISGPTEVYLTDTKSCATVTWTASATGGTSGYSYSWYMGTTLVGSGTSYSKNYCQTNQTVTVKVVAKDSANTTAQATHTTDIIYTSSDPCVNPNGASGTDVISPITPCN
jgi:hypothetical protein